MLDFYEGGFNYELKKSFITLKKNNFFDSGNKIEAYVYFNNDTKIELGNVWSLFDWQQRYGLISRLVAKEYMKLRSRSNEIDLLSEYEKLYNRISSKL